MRYRSISAGQLSCAVSVWHGPRGFEVEVITLGRRALYRVTQVLGGRRWHVANCATISEVSRHVDLADLVEVVDLPVRAARKAAS